MFSFGCGIGESYPLCDICLYVLFFISRPLRSRTQRKATFSSNQEILIGGKIFSATGAKGFQPREVCRRHESFSPIGISPIGEKFHSLRSLRTLRETSFHLVAATPLCVLGGWWIRYRIYELIYYALCYFVGIGEQWNHSAILIMNPN